MTVAVKAVPRSRATRAVGVQADALRVQIAAPPHEGQLERGALRVPRRAAGLRAPAARIRRGSGGARKLVEIDGDPRADRGASWSRRLGADGTGGVRLTSAKPTTRDAVMQAIERRRRRQTKARWWRFAACAALVLVLDQIAKVADPRRPWSRARRSTSSPASTSRA